MSIEHSKELMNLAADNIRILAASMVERAKSGHPGGAMGGADFINVLYSEFLNFDPDEATWRCRDRFFLDPGHMSPMLYSQLALIGNYTIDELKQFRQWGSPTPGHPEVCPQRGIENTSGPLGQGHTYAVGAAIAAKALYARTGNPGFNKEKIYAYISDGGVQEEISQGAGRIAGHLGLNNLIMFFDANEVQLSTDTSSVISEDTGMKYRAWNWNVLEIDGNDADQIRNALKAANEEESRPTLIIGHCVMGKGARKADGTSYEHNCKTHGAPLGGDAYINTIKNLGGDPENPFVIREQVRQMYDDRKADLRKIVAARRAEEKEWELANPEKLEEVYVLAISANGSSDFDAYAVYDDASTSATSTFSPADWFGSYESGKEAQYGLSRIIRSAADTYSADDIDNRYNFRTYEYTMELDRTKMTKALTFKSKVNGAYPTILAVSKKGYKEPASGIENLTTGNGAQTVVGIYSLDGMKLNSLRKGINIIKMSDGSVKKVLVRK